MDMSFRHAAKRKTLHVGLVGQQSRVVGQVARSPIRNWLTSAKVLEDLGVHSSGLTGQASLGGGPFPRQFRQCRSRGEIERLVVRVSDRQNKQQFARRMPGRRTMTNSLSADL